jgi:predicted  nucleic acid-binding Zn-ribbon protein
MLILGGAVTTVVTGLVNWRVGKGKTDADIQKILREQNRADIEALEKRFEREIEALRKDLSAARDEIRQNHKEINEWREKCFNLQDQNNTLRANYQRLANKFEALRAKFELLTQKPAPKEFYDPDPESEDQL